MAGRSDSTDSTGHPLEGVLERLLRRERGDPPGPGVSTSSDESVTVSPATHQRRMLVVAALGRDGGRSAMVDVARRAVRVGRSPLLVDLGGDGGDASEGAGAALGGPLGVSVPLVVVPVGLSGLQREDPEKLPAVLDPLRRRESSSDLLVLRMPTARVSLARAVFLSGGLVVPVGGSDKVLHEAFGLVDDLIESFPRVRMWPWDPDGKTVERFREMAHDFLRLDVDPLPEDGPSMERLLDGLSPAPDAGFVAALITPAAPAPPPPQLLELRTIRL